MLPLEITFFLMVAIWGMVGIVRGFSKEVGATIAIILAMTGVSLFGPIAIDAWNSTVGLFLKSVKITVGSVPSGTPALCYTPSYQQFFFYLAIFTAVVFMGYQGETLGVPTSLSKVHSSVVGLFIGLVNGWLIAGDLWWFLGKCAAYHIPALGLDGPTIQAGLSNTATTIFKLLPFNVIGSPIVLVGILFVLLVLRIFK